jgi:GNAT superfamily N-acetyltransferase
LLRIADVTEENVEDVLMICSGNRPHAPMDDPVLEKGRKLKRQWLLDMLEHNGCCGKIAYLNEKPVGQILFYPEVTIPYISTPRTDVIYLKCIYIAVPDAQHQGVGDALMKALINECHTGVECLGGRPCRFLVTQPFPHEGTLPLTDFYAKYGFKQGQQEMFLEVNGKYVPQELLEYRSLPEDRDKVLLIYNQDCEWGYFFVTTVKELIQKNYPNLPIETYNNWKTPEEYLKHPHRPLIAASIIVNAQLNRNPFVFWIDRKAFLRDVDEALRHSSPTQE